MMKLKELMKSQKIDSLILVPGPNLYYFSGLKMHTSERSTMLFVNAQGKDCIFLPKLEMPNATSILKDEYTYYGYSDEEGPDQVFNNMSNALGLDGRKLGVEFLHMRVAEHELLRRNVSGFSLINAEPSIAEIRMVKDDEEISCMRKATEITEKALAATVKAIKPGMTELEIGNRFKIEALSFGSGEFPKEPIVASGPRSASPHTKTSARPVNAGEMIIMDVGATFQGYICDITRTFVIGHIDDEFRKIYEVVKKANETAIRVSRPKFTAEELDGMARKVIETEGYGQYFIHRTGHGLGIEEHEPPYIVKGNKLELKIGMTFTIEPGIYIPGKGGVRIEDNVVVTGQGLDTLTSYPTELKIL
jgi:Xaa-Pro aminopeptidase